MKKLSVLYLLLLSSAIVSCNKDNDDAKDNGGATGIWKMLAVEVVSGSDSTVFSTENTAGCAIHTTYELNADQTFHILYYDNYRGSCVIEQEATGTYSYDSRTKTIHFNRDGSVILSWRLESVTADRIGVIKNEGFDYNDDAVSDQEILILVKAL